MLVSKQQHVSMSLEVEGLGLGSRSRKRVEVYGSSVEVRVRGLRFDFYAAMSYGRLGLQASPHSCPSAPLERCCKSISFQASMGNLYG